MEVAPFTLESLVKGAEDGNLPQTIQRRFVTPAVANPRNPTHVIGSDVAGKIRENAVEYGTTIPPRRRIVTPQAGVEPPKGPASGLPG